MRSLKTILVLLAAATAGLGWAAPGMAQDTGSSAVVRVDLAAGGASQSLSLPKGKSAIVELPIDARDVLVTNPKVADAVLRTPRRIYVLGVAAGQTDAVFFDAQGRRILSLDVRVDQDTAALAQTINRILPGAQVRVDAMNDSVILSGQVQNAGDADKAVQIARATVSKPEQVLNMLTVAGKDQVMLKVRIVEMQRSVIKQLGFDLAAAIGNAGEMQYLVSKPTTYGVNGSLLGGISATAQRTATDGGPDATAGTLNAFERVGLVRTLAEPNLTAVSGEAAKFLAGGEFPVPTGSDSTGKVSIEFKPFGVGLGFTPVVLSGGRIALTVSTEVSELTTEGAFTLSAGTSSTLTVPALKVRRASTSVELPSGGALMIAGLLQETSKQTLDSLPGMMTLPVLGALFRSRDYQSGETELVVIVTPYIVHPTSPDRLQTPADGMKFADDVSSILLGRLNKTYKVKPQATAGHTYEGPYGYVIE
ncbi:type II and III secretion system protein family protein [Phenylobacterium sp.]|uniref:type II and III secretion system protein family protein n=1 Tax=Phenylobacterium sp. TaxID=1871053 RepID=UPI0035B15C8F